MIGFSRVACAALTLLLVAPMSPTSLAAATTDVAAPLRYTVKFPEPQTHYAEIVVDVPTDGRPAVTLMMPVWTPGSYLVREYARHVENFSARGADGKALEVSKTRKNRWTIQTGGAERVQVSYRVYAREMGVQSSWIDAGFALLNGAATFLTLAEDAGPRPHEVALILPPGWLKSFTGLPDAPGGGAHRFVAPDFDTLVDCPIYAGNPAVYEFQVDGKPHYLVNEGEHGVWDGPRSARDVEAIVRVQRDFWGSLPYDKYIFFNLLTESGGGLEHKNSTVLMASRWATRRRADYLGWLNLVSHEYFHTWNVKRMRPAELGPFDYENEVTTRSLWIAEGFTSYYDRIFVRRAGLCTVEEFLAGDPPGAAAEVDRTRNDIEVLHDTPGRLVQPLESASYDAWIKFYRRDENTANTGISYYTKGAVVAFLLDARIRAATNGAKSLDDLMRLAYERFSGAQGYTPEQFRALASEVAGTDLSGFFARTLESTEELDYTEALQQFGLRFAEPKAEGGKSEGTAEPKPAKAWLGLGTKSEDGRLVVTRVKRGTPGFAAGFNVGDEIIALGDERIRAGQWGRRMEQFRPNETTSVLIARRDRLMRLDATFGVEPPNRWAVERDPKADDSAKARRRAWLGSE